MASPTCASSECEVAIVGGGPAGAAASLALAKRGVHCLLLERTNYEKFRIGETLAAEGVATLGKLGAKLAFLGDEHLSSLGVRSAWGEAKLSERTSIASVNGLGFHLERRCFDRSLSDLCQAAGVEVRRQARVVQVEQHADGWSLTLAEPGGIRRVAARFVVDASGRSLSVAKRAGARWLSFDRTFALYTLLNTEHLPPATRHEQVLSVEAVAVGFWYSAPLPQNRLLLALLTDLDVFRAGSAALAERFRALLGESQHTRERVGALPPQQRPQALRADSGCLDRAAGSNWLAVGDAAASFDPLSGSGIAKALDSGLRASESVIALLGGDMRAASEYSLENARRVARHHAERALIYRAERRFPEAAFWRRRQGLAARPA